MKKFTVIILTIMMITSLIACSQEETALGETVESLYDGIKHYNDHVAVIETSSQRFMLYYEVPYSEPQPTIQRYHNDDQLQQMVRTQLLPTELNNDTAITAYAWALEPILEATGNIPDEYFPVAASIFSNNVVLFVYSPVYYVELRELFTRFRENLIIHSENDLPYQFYNVTEQEIFVFASAEDGHIIHIE